MHVRFSFITLISLLILNILIKLYLNHFPFFSYLHFLPYTPLPLKFIVLFNYLCVCAYEQYINVSFWVHAMLLVFIWFVHLIFGIGQLLRDYFLVKTSSLNNHWLSINLTLGGQCEMSPIHVDMSPGIIMSKVLFMWSHSSKI